MRFTKLEINHWQQFEKIDISIHERLTIFTGANGSGKTTLLNILAKHFGWEKLSLATPRLNKITGQYSFSNHLDNDEDPNEANIIGRVSYSNQSASEISIHETGYAVNQLYIRNISTLESLQGFLIPSHRPIFTYQRTENISTSDKDRLQVFVEVAHISKQKYSGNEIYNNQSISFIMKNTLINWVIRGYGNLIMPADKKQRLNFEGFQSVLKKVLPETLGFESLQIREMEIIFVCNDGNDEFLLESASGGISALIDIAWQIYLFSTQENSDFTVIIDEIENHLHPTMQRTILQNLINAFPNARFIVSTHSPLVVGSVKDSAVYALRYNENNKVVSEYLDLVDKAKTASEILDEVLGVSFTMPVWVEDKLNEIINAYSQKELTSDYFANLREELGNAGLGSLMPYAIQSVVEIRG